MPLWKIATLLTAFALPSLLLPPPPASADEIDYVVLLDMNGIQYPSAEDAMNLGNAICEGLQAGATVPALLKMVTTKTGLQADDAMTVVLAAPFAICEELQWVVDEYLDGPQQESASGIRLEHAI